MTVHSGWSACGPRKTATRRGPGNPATPARCATPGARGAVSTARVGARSAFGCRRGVRRARGLRGGGDLRARRPSLGPGTRRLSDADRAAGDHLLLRAPGMLPVPESATRLRERRRSAGRVGCGGAAFLRNAHRGRAGRELPAKRGSRVLLSASHSSLCGQSAVTSPVDRACVAFAVSASTSASCTTLDAGICQPQTSGRTRQCTTPCCSGVGGSGT